MPCFEGSASTSLRIRVILRRLLATDAIVPGYPIEVFIVVMLQEGVDVLLQLAIRVNLVHLMTQLDQIAISRDDGSRVLLVVQLVIISGVQLLELLHQIPR
eukprot:SAG11_NODE_315_length_10858_cov_14.578977_12_plen_101_part_00